MIITKAKKGSDDYLIDMCDYAISDLVKEKTDLIRAYNYFNCERDHYQYEHLEKNYGVGSPTSVGFTPLTRKHIEAIVGEYLTMKPKPRISCKDSSTLSNIFRDKQLEVAGKQKKYVSQFLENAIYSAIFKKDDGQQDRKIVDQEIERQLNQIDDSVNRNFISNYEIAAQYICEYAMQNREIDFYNKTEQLLLDLLITGQAYYKVVATKNKKNFRIKLCSPLNTWIDKNPNSRYMKNGYKAVFREWMSPEEIEIKYGDYLSQKELESLKDWKNLYDSEGEFALISGQKQRCVKLNNGKTVFQDVGIHPLDSDTTIRWDLIPVYDVEWIDSKKEKDGWIGYCYHVIRIGADTYILDLDDVSLPRNMDDAEPRLSINGLWYTDGYNGPYSLMLKTMDLQDVYDLNLFKKDNAIAQAGTKGAIIDWPSLPEQLGDTPEERLINFQAYRKMGLSLIDSSQEGIQNINTIYNGFDDTISVGVIQAYQVSITMIEDLVSQITGVFRERLGGIEQRDAVANVALGMQQSYIITKRYYKCMDSLVKEILSDCVDMAKIVYKDGLTGQIVLGDLKEIFTILPEYYSFTSFDISIADTEELVKEQELIKQLASNLVGNNYIDPEVWLIVSTSKSLTEMKELVRKSIREKKIENSQIQQLTQQLQEAEKSIKQMQTQLEQSTKKIASLNERKLNIEQQNNQMDQEIAYYKINKESELKNRELDLIQQRTKIEAAELLDDNKRNDEVQNKKI